MVWNVPYYPSSTRIVSGSCVVVLWMLWWWWWLWGQSGRLAGCNKVSMPDTACCKSQKSAAQSVVHGRAYRFMPTRNTIVQTPKTRDKEASARQGQVTQRCHEQSRNKGGPHEKESQRSHLSIREGPRKRLLNICMICMRVLPKISLPV